MNIGLATYSGWWTILPMTETGRMIRKDMNIMMMKSMRPCYLSAAGFFPVSLETSTAVRDLLLIPRPIYPLNTIDNAMINTINNE